MKRLFIIYIIVGLFISVFSFSIKQDNNDEFHSSFVGIKDEKQIIDEPIDIDYGEMGNLKYGSIGEQLIVNCEIFRNDNPYDSYSYDEKNFYVGDIVHAGDIVGDNTILNTGIISGMDNNCFYVDQFSNYSAKGDYFSVSEKNIKKIGEIFDNKAIKVVKEYVNEVECDINVKYNKDSNNYEFDLTNLEFNYFPIEGEFINLYYYFSSSCVGYYLLNSYVWEINGNYYAVNQDKVIFKLDVIDIIDNYVFVKKNNLKYDDKFIQYNEQYSKYFEIESLSED